MMTTNHTPGPKKKYFVQSKASTARFLADMAKVCTPEDAVLVAAAPELLRALDNLTRAANVDEPDALQMFVAIEHARAALAKLQS